SYSTIRDKVLIISSNWDSVISDPLGSVKPDSNWFSDAPVILPGWPENTGCMCIGFHRGRDSIFASCNPACSEFAETLEILGSIIMEVSQQLSSASLPPKISTPGTSAKRSLYLSRQHRRRSIISSRRDNCALPSAASRLLMR